MDWDSPGGVEECSWGRIDEQFMFCWTTCSVLATANSLRAASKNMSSKPTNSKPCGFGPFSPRLKFPSPRLKFPSLEPPGAQIERPTPRLSMDGPMAASRAMDRVLVVSHPVEVEEVSSPRSGDSGEEGDKPQTLVGLDSQMSSDSQWALLAMGEAEFEGKVIGRPVQLEGLEAAASREEKWPRLSVELTVEEGDQVRVRMAVDDALPGGDAPRHGANIRGLGRVDQDLTFPAWIADKTMDKGSVDLHAIGRGSGAAGGGDGEAGADGLKVVDFFPMADPASQGEDSPTADGPYLSLMQDDSLGAFPTCAGQLDMSDDYCGMSFSFDCSVASVGGEGSWENTRSGASGSGANAQVSSTSEEAAAKEAACMAGWEREFQDSAKALMRSFGEPCKEGDAVTCRKGRPQRGRRPASVCSEESWQSWSPAEFVKNRLLCGRNTHTILDRSPSTTRDRARKTSGAGLVSRFFGRFFCRNRPPPDE